MLPPQRQGGRDEIIQDSFDGATAMMPMNGCSGISISGENSATLRFTSSRITLRTGALSRSGSTPTRGPELFTP